MKTSFRKVFLTTMVAAAATKALPDYLSSAEAAKVWRETGMQPGRQGAAD